MLVFLPVVRGNGNPRLAKMNSAREEAISQGYKDETCPRCGGLFEAQIHFIHCDAKPCPMVSTKDARTFLQMLTDSGKHHD